MQSIGTVPLLVLDDFGMRKLPHTAAEDLLEIVMRRYERFSTLLTSNRPVEDWIFLTPGSEMDSRYRAVTSDIRKNYSVSVPCVPVCRRVKRCGCSRLLVLGIHTDVND